jgi:hypothetical protein
MIKNLDRTSCKHTCMQANIRRYDSTSLNSNIAASMAISLSQEPPSKNKGRFQAPVGCSCPSVYHRPFDVVHCRSSMLVMHGLCMQLKRIYDVANSPLPAPGDMLSRGVQTSKNRDFRIAYRRSMM